MEKEIIFVFLKKLNKLDKCNSKSNFSDRILEEVYNRLFLLYITD